MFSLVIYDKNKCYELIKKVKNIKVKKNKLFVFFNHSNDCRKCYCYNLSYYTKFELVDFIDI